MTTLSARTGNRTGLLGAFAWMAAALVAFSTFAIAGREAGRQLDAIQIMLWRGPLSLAILIVFAAVTGARPATRRLPLHVVRSMVHFGAQWSWLTALSLIPLAELFALEFTAPLWVAMLAPLILGERLTPVRIFAALLGFIGVLIVVRPGLQTVSQGTLLGLLSAVGFAGGLLATKLLTRTDSPFTIVFYMMAIQTVFGLILGLPRFVVPTPATAGWLLLIALAGLAAHVSIAQAFSRADAVLVAPMDFIRLPLIAVVGMLIYGETLHPAVFAGAAVIIAANIVNLRAERRRRP